MALTTSPPHSTAVSSVAAWARPTRPNELAARAAAAVLRVCLLVSTVMIVSPLAFGFAFGERPSPRACPNSAIAGEKLQYTTDDAQFLPHQCMRVTGLFCLRPNIEVLRQKS